MIKKLAATNYQRVAWVIGLLAAAQPVWAQDNYAGILDLLASNDYHTRRQASLRLLTDHKLAAEQIDRLYADATGPEQQHRLLDVARHHLLLRIAHERFADSKSGSLGVSLGPIEQNAIRGLDQPAACVAKTYAGFPAFCHLNAGDMIIAINGKRAAGLKGGQITSFFVNEIKKHKPGQTICLSVRRDETTIDLTITLANIDALEGLYQAEAIRRPPQQQKVVLNGQWVIPVGLLTQIRQLPLHPQYQALWEARREQLQQLSEKHDPPNAHAN